MEDDLKNKIKWKTTSKIKYNGRPPQKNKNGRQPPRKMKGDLKKKIWKTTPNKIMENNLKIFFFKWKTT
jgi:hypothetical protein